MMNTFFQMSKKKKLSYIVRGTQSDNFDLLQKGRLDPIIPKRLTGVYDELFDFDSCELARHLSMIDHSLYRHILVNQLLFERRAPNLRTFRAEK